MDTEHLAMQMGTLHGRQSLPGFTAGHKSDGLTIATGPGTCAPGVDANGDGKITWVNGEGGLKDARKHMGFMQKGEGLSS